ncbi:hypothetical protein [Dactylosporangium sp. CA-092794]|uniref:hypothetical protein n=1 Tax=Dactylosporangium sp. CA-092794 TaxID=3239929 RepID=UPI003D93A623
MSSQTDQQPAAPVRATDPQPAATPPKTSRMKTVVVGVVAALVLGGGGFAVYKAADNGSSPTSQQAGPGGNGMGGPGGFTRFDGAIGGADGVAGALYGDFTASDGNGGYVTKRLQTGTVTDVSATSITAKSADGHTTTFVIGAGTTVDNGDDQVSDVKAGDTVTVVGTVDGTQATATTITDSTLTQGN